MTLAIVRLDDATQFAVARIMEAGVGGVDQQLSRLFTPADCLLAHDRLHDGVEAALGCVQVARNLRAVHHADKLLRRGAQAHVVLEAIGCGTLRARFLQSGGGKFD